MRVAPSVCKHSHGSLNVPIEHHPTIRYMIYNGYYKVISNIPKMGQLPTPDSYLVSCFNTLKVIGDHWRPKYVLGAIKPARHR